MDERESDEAAGRLLEAIRDVAAGRAKRDRRNRTRRERDQAMRDLGLRKVRGALGGTYWE
jgi:hypothetical protein